MNLLVSEVARHLHGSEAGIISRSKRQEDCEARNLVMYVAHCRMGLSTYAIGAYLGRHHTTVAIQVEQARKQFPDVITKAALLGDNVDKRLYPPEGQCPRCHGTGRLAGGVKR